MTGGGVKERFLIVILRLAEESQRNGLFFEILRFRFRSE
jgi:hypothetical protein